MAYAWTISDSDNTFFEGGWKTYEASGGYSAEEIETLREKFVRGNTELSSELLRLVDGLVTGVTVELQGLEGDTLTSVVTIGVRPGSLLVHDIDTDDTYIGRDVYDVIEHINAGGGGLPLYAVSSLTAE